MNDIKNAYILIQTIVDTQDNLVVIIENDKPVLINKSFKNFFGVSSFKQYTTDFGDFINNFVPHPSYFHSGKVEEGQTWIESLNALPEKDKIVSMLSTSHEPRAFSIKVDTTHEDYTVLSLEDVSANLIKCIMIENDMNMDKKTGAYTKDYFLHTAEILQDGAAYNEKDIGLSMIRFFNVDEDTLKTNVEAIKAVIRQNDMLVKYSNNTLLLAYLTDKKDNAIVFSKKVYKVINQSQSCMVVDIVAKGLKIPNTIKIMRTALDELNKNEMKVL